MDTKDSTGAYYWMLISWSPDDAPVRHKMLYASTKATLKQEFGSGQIKEELHGTVKVLALCVITQPTLSLLYIQRFFKVYPLLNICNHHCVILGGHNIKWFPETQKK